MLAVLTGGTGGAKLIQGLSAETDPAELVIVCNTADDFVFHGLHISPDLDTIAYTLAGVADTERGWGIKGDTFATLEWIGKYGGERWFKVGDRDLATHLTRTRLLNEGLTLTQATEKISKALGVTSAIVPMSDDKVETRIQTPKGEISFQDYFVKQRWSSEVRGVAYAGAEKSRPAPGVVEAIRNARAVIVCPSNPVTSIGPILAVPGVGSALKEAKARVIGVSPIIQGVAVTGPADKLMVATGMEASSFGVAKAYADFLDTFVIAPEDGSQRNRIEALGVKTVSTAIRMSNLDDKRRLAREVLALV
jgi:LPPG:FO 2-phospho-L-lactate transferase